MIDTILFYIAVIALVVFFIYIILAAGFFLFVKFWINREEKYVRRGDEE